MKKLIKLNVLDNIATALVELKINEQVIEPIDGIEIVCQELIPAGHKIALQNLSEKDAVIKYGKVIGFLTADVKKGCLVHVHNLKSARGKELGGNNHE